MSSQERSDNLSFSTYRVTLPQGASLPPVRVVASSTGSLMQTSIKNGQPVSKAVLPKNAVAKKTVSVMTTALIVDDSLLNRKMLAKIVSPLVNTVLFAADGLECIVMVKDMLEKEQHLNVVFMDNVMPNMNGLEATAYLRQELNYSGPIVGVTGNCLPEQVDEFTAAGATIVLSKPIDVGQVKLIINGQFICVLSRFSLLFTLFVLYYWQ